MNKNLLKKLTQYFKTNCNVLLIDLSYKRNCIEILITINYFFSDKLFE